MDKNTENFKKNFSNYAKILISSIEDIQLVIDGLRKIELSTKEKKLPSAKEGLQFYLKRRYLNNWIMLRYNHETDLPLSLIDIVSSLRSLISFNEPNSASELFDYSNLLKEVLKVNNHRPCRWLFQTTTPDNVIRRCLSRFEVVRA